MDFVKKRAFFFLLVQFFMFLSFNKSFSSTSLLVQHSQNAIEKLTQVLEEKSKNLLKRQEETEQIFAALLEFSKPIIQKSLLFSSPHEYTRIRLLLESLAREGQKALLDLNQEIAELKVIREILVKEEKEILKNNFSEIR
ncbi:MAG: hypothetical protein JSS34_07740 [Proteobacteria bacterium]|nr:hypothetical protein [Pseudomonadota bacterium]